MDRSPKQVLISAGLAMTTTNLKATFDMPFVCQRVKQVGMLLVGASAHATAGVIYVTWAPKAGVTTNQDSATTGNIAILKKTASVAQQGVFVYARPTSIVTSSGWNQSNGVGYLTNEYIFPIGYQILFYLHTANGEACTWDAYVEVEEIDIDVSDLTYSTQAGTVGYLWDSTYPGVLVTP
jgi:hypothetical protein